MIQPGISVEIAIGADVVTEREMKIQAECGVSHKSKV
jgi:hypothetical protein